MTNKVIIAVVCYGLFFYFLNHEYDFFISNKWKWLYYFLYTFFEFWFFTFFILVHVTDKKTKAILIGSAILFSLFLVIYYTYFPLKRVDAVPIGIETILLYLFIMPYLFSQFRADNSERIFKQFHFWIVIGIMFYLAGTFFFNILGNEFNNQEIRMYWHYSFLADIFKNLFFSIAIIVYATQSTKKIEKVNPLPNLDFTL